VEQFAWIPAKMFGSYCENDTPAIRYVTEVTFARGPLEYASPLGKLSSRPLQITDETAWTERLLAVAPADDNKAFASFMTMSNLSEP
jgi:hypothetical protein